MIKATPATVRNAHKQTVLAWKFTWQAERIDELMARRANLRRNHVKGALTRAELAGMVQH